MTFPRLPRWPHPRLVIGICAASLLVSVLAFTAGFQLRNSDQRLLANSTKDITTTARVEMRSTTGPTGTGSLRAGGSISVPAFTPADARVAVVTAVGPAVGEAVIEGSVLAAVSQRPVIALSLSSPHFRDLHQGDTGEDVHALNVVLARLGYDVSAESGEYRWDTTRAVRALYRHIGYEPPAGSASTSTNGSTSGDPQGGSAAPAQQQTTPAPQAPALGSLLPFNEVVSVPAGYLVDKRPEVGQGLKDGDEFITARAPTTLGTVRLNALEAKGVEVGQKVTIADPDGGAKGEGAVQAMGDFQGPSKSDSGDATKPAGYDVQVELSAQAQKDLARSTNVTFSFTTASSPVPAVPLSALHQDGVQQYVFKKSGRKFIRVNVEVSSTSDGWALLANDDLSAIDVVQLTK